MKKIIVILVVICILIGVVLGIYMYSKKQTKWLDERIIAHALGGYDGKSYTNAKEALIYNYDKGDRIFELDLSVTSDNKVVGLHNWQKNDDGTETVMNLEDFLAKPVFEKYTAIEIDYIIDWIDKHPDTYIVTDTKYNIPMVLNLVVERAKELKKEKVLNNFIIQIGRMGEEKDVRDVYPFKNIILTLYLRGFSQDINDFEQIAKYCSENNIQGITMWYYWWHDNFKEIKDKYGVKVNIHTLNDAEEAKKYLNAGVDAIYTDFLYKEDLN